VEEKRSVLCNAPPHPPLLFRPPYGKITPRQAFVIKKLGYQIIMWDVLSKDYEPSIHPMEVVENVLQHLQPGSIIVLHDNLKSDQTLRVALPLILKGIKKYLNKKFYLICRMV
jgi:peptidoglycan/xylan/chitin deacetylase (PgdA/CDA1 family)